MSDMDIVGATSRGADEEEGAEGAEDYLHHGGIGGGARDRRTSGCSSGANSQVMHGRLPDASSGGDKGVNGTLTARRCSEGEQRRMVDITRDKPIKVTVRIMVPVRDHPKFNFVGKLLGPKGNSLKRLQEDTMTKMAILGRGSMRDKHKEEELRTSGDPKFSHLHDDLHVEVTAFAPPAEAHARIAYALAEVRRFLVPDYNDEIRQEQMWEMQVLNTQRKPGGLIGDLLSAAAASATGGGHRSSNHSSATSSDSRNGSLSPASPPPATGGADLLVAQELLQHPALRGCMDQQQRGQQNNSTGTANVCRKRPLLTGASNRLAMSPTKRTVLSILARARAAQAKELPEYHQISNGRGGGISVLHEDAISSGNLV